MAGTSADALLHDNAEMLPDLVALRNQLHRHPELGLDLRRVPFVAGVPRFVWGQIPRDTAKWAVAALAGNAHAAMRHAMSLCYNAGYIRECWTSARGAQALPPGAPGTPPSSG